jgi:hypothetical protein
MRRNAWQKSIARSYGGGDYAHIADQGEVRSDDLGTCGDTLFRFLMVELADGEDCDTQEEAVRRVARARDQLNDAISVLEVL